MNAPKPAAPSTTRVRHRPTSPTDVRSLLLDSLQARWHTLRAELKRCQKHFSEEAVHDLRVATRRLSATLDLVASIDPEVELRKVRRALKQLLKLLGPLRDVQVQVIAIDKMLPSFPELQGFYDTLVKRERKLVQHLGVDLKRVKTGKMTKGIGVAVRQVEAFLDTPAVQRERRNAAIHAVEIAFNQVVERRQAIDPSDSASVHRMRVAFKKFRYLVESLAPALNGVTAKQLKAMNAFQGSMGDIQDAEVLLTNVLTFARKHGGQGETALARPLEELSRRRTALIETFLSSADSLFTFWNPMA